MRHVQQIGKTGVIRILSRKNSRLNIAIVLGKKT